MPQESSRFQRLLRKLLPVLHGFVMAFGAILILVLAIMYSAHDQASANQMPSVQSAMLNASKPRPSTPESLIQPPAPQKVAAPGLSDTTTQPPKAAPSAVVLAPAPLPQPWKWTPLRDDVTLFFRTEIPDFGGLPLLHYAVMLDDGEWVSQLIARGADANEPTPSGDSLLCSAVRLGAANSVRALVYGGAEVTAPGLEKQPPLTLAALRRGTDIYRSLLAAGADPNTRFSTPVTKALLERVTIKDLKNALESDRGVTPLIACSSRGDVEGAAELLRWGASPSKCTTRYHRYPINFAAAQGYLFLMRIILGRQPESEPEILVTIDLSKQRAWVTKEGQIIDTCAVSTGREGYNTPAGRYVITDKHRSWTSTLYHVAMPFFMRLNCSAIGLHSGYVTGRPASHGCIRLPYDKAKKFFGICEVGDEVQIVY